MKLSFIVPMFNTERYIIKCIKSLINQNIKYNYEIIVIDDGSTDNSYEVINKFKEINNIRNLKIFKQLNKGQGAARNFGMKVSKGEYISFIDSDDFLRENMFNNLIDIMDRKHVDFIHFNYADWYDENFFKIRKMKLKENVIFKGKDIFKYENGITVSPCDKIFRKKFLERINFKFTEGRYAEDAYDITTLYYKANKILIKNDLIYYYRRTNSDSTRNNKDEKRTFKLLKDKIYIANKLNDFCEVNKWQTNYTRTIILRLLLAFFINKKFLKKKFRKEITKDISLKDILCIIIKNIKLKDFYLYFNIIFNKFIERSKKKWR